MDTNAKPEPDSLKKKLGKKPPVIKQTLTSYRRMLKANPLLKYEPEGAEIQQILAAKSASNIGTSKGKSEQPLRGQPETNNWNPEFQKPRNPIQRSQSARVKPVSTLLTINGRNNIGRDLISGNGFGNRRGYTNKNQLVPLDILKNSTTGFNTPCMSSTKVETHFLGKNLNQVNVKKATGSRQVLKPEIRVTEAKSSKVQKRNSREPIRRSLSTGHINSKKGHKFEPKDSYRKVGSPNTNHQSLENLSTNEDPNAKSPFSPILEEHSRDTSYVFKTPSAYERRSVGKFTPKSLNGVKTTSFRASTPAPMVLQQRLNDWLRKRGKNLSTFQHLKCFGLSHNHQKNAVAHVQEEENKENIEVEDEVSSSYEDLHIVVLNEDKEIEEVKELENLSFEELERISKEALVELQNLVKEGYPRGQCECWLELIRNKYRNVEEEPEYWECRAAIEQSVGNIHNAVECYKTAIIQGAEVKTVDQSLDNLLRKFSLLNINTNNKEEKNKVDKERERILQESRNVFKSSIIQFAVQERKLKRKDKTVASEGKVKLVATPVRRSTRLSRSAYVSTPGVTMCCSLKELELNVDFEKNKALC